MCYVTESSYVIIFMFPELLSLPPATIKIIMSGNLTKVTTFVGAGTRNSRKTHQPDPKI